jgi:hypothetical protein
MFTRAQVIQKVLDAVGGSTYLEIGVAHAETLLAVRAPLRIGIDPARPSRRIIDYAAGALSRTLNRLGDDIYLEIGAAPTDTGLRARPVSEVISSAPGVASAGDQPLGEGVLRFYQLTSDVFFAGAADMLARTGIDVAFVDGLHEWRQAVRDVEACLAHLNEGGVVVMHDCLPTKAIYATPADQLETARQSPEWDGTWTGDVWKAAVWLRASRDDLRVCVLDCDWGLGLITRGTPESMLAYTDAEIAAMSFDDFRARRTEILNLKEPTYLDQFLADHVASFRPQSAPASI